MKDIGIIGSADGPTSVYVKEENVTTEEVIVNDSLTEELNNRTLGENLDAGVKIMGIGMVAVFGVLTILYLDIKLMGVFAKTKKDDEK